jgi:hypothetical protein
MKMNWATLKGFWGCAAALILTCMLSEGRGLADEVPGKLIPPRGNVEIARGYGVGVQIYHSAPSPTDPTQFVWQFFAPEATLFDDGRPIIHHFGGPSWQANDGSLVVGALFASVPSPRPNAVAWLLLTGASHAGHGLLSEVSFIQRLDTIGGAAPSTPPTQAGLEVRVPYTATYVFFEPKGRSSDEHR